MRQAAISRKTKETDIQLFLNLDGTGKAEIDTGVGFLNHMLELLAFHSGFDLTVRCKGEGPGAESRRRGARPSRRPG